MGKTGKKKVVKKGKKKVKNHITSKKFSKYKIESSGKITKSKTCSKCGPASFLGEHKDRFHCGKCGYIEIKK